jgi:hypothetical protein
VCAIVTCADTRETCPWRRLPSLLGPVSRGKKLTKAERRHRREQRERTIADKVDDLSCGCGAADAFAAMCGLAHEEAGFNLDMVLAAEALWRRGAGSEHALTTALGDLRAELERQRALMRGLEERFDSLIAMAPSNHLQPLPDDVERIRDALLGPPPVHVAS